jgi:RNA-binding protein YlmH
VKVNYVTIYEGSYMCNGVNETISVKRNGKVMLGGIVSHTRNNRLVIRVFKYT